MKRKTSNAVPATISLLLHGALFASLILAFDFDRTPDLAIPLALNATLVTENAVVIPPQVEAPPEVEEEPPPPQPQSDTQEQERLAAEQRKREQDAAEEKARLQKIEREKEEAEKERKAEEERKRKEAEAEEERLRKEAEEKRLADIEAQRIENERLRREAEDAARKEALAEESQILEAQAASAEAAYIFKIKQSVTRHWVQPVTAEEGLDCAVKVTQTTGGEVTRVEFGSCNGDATVRRSIDAAVRKASPLPRPRDPSVFDRQITLYFKT